MTQPPLSDRIAPLLPALDQIATTIAQRGAFDDTDLQVLLLGMGIEDDWEKSELGRWTTILTAAREPGRQDLSRRALVMRGVPEDAAARAVATVAATPPPTPPPPPYRTTAGPGSNAWMWAMAIVVLALIVLGAFWLWRQSVASQTALVVPTTVPTALPPTIPPTAIPLPATVTATARNDVPPPLIALTATTAPIVPTNTAVPPTLAPTQAPPTATRAAPTNTSPPPATPTPIPPTRTPRPQATLSPAAAACSPRPGESFFSFWADAGLFNRVGCPTNNERGVVTSYQPFQRGLMLYRQDQALIYAIYDDGTWQQFQDTWRDGEPEYSCTNDSTPARTPPTPRRGIGKVWCTQAGIRDKLGNALRDESGNTRPIQDFQQGLMFRIPERDVAIYALINDSRQWAGS